MQSKMIKWGICDILYAVSMVFVSSFVLSSEGRNVIEDVFVDLFKEI